MISNSFKVTDHMIADPSDGYYWRIHIKLTDQHGNTLITTDTSAPIVVRDDLGVMSFILSHDLYLFLENRTSLLVWVNDSVIKFNTVNSTTPSPNLDSGIKWTDWTWVGNYMCRCFSSHLNIIMAKI